MICSLASVMRIHLRVACYSQRSVGWISRSHYPTCVPYGLTINLVRDLKGPSFNTPLIVTAVYFIVFSKFSNLNSIDPFLLSGFLFSKFVLKMSLPLRHFSKIFPPKWSDVMLVILSIILLVVLTILSVLLYVINLPCFYTFVSYGERFVGNISFFAFI